jgi:hypothetical protein
VLVFLRSSSQNWAGTPLMEGALGWISWGEEGEGKVGMMIRPLASGSADTRCSAHGARLDEVPPEEHVEDG